MRKGLWKSIAIGAVALVSAIGVVACGDNDSNYCVEGTTTYFINDTLVVDNLKLKIGKNVVNVTSDMIKNLDQIDMSTAGTKIITIEYNGVTYEYTIEVRANTVTKIELKDGYTVTYVVGEDFQPQATIIVTRLKGNTEEVKVTYSMITNIPDMTVVGEHTVTISYEDRQCSYTINVTEE